MRWGRSLCDKGQLEVVDDFIHNLMVGEKGDHLHCSSASRTDHGIDLIDLTHHLGPALGGDWAEFLLHHPEREGLQACLAELASMSVSVEAGVTNCDLAPVRNKHPGDGEDDLAVRDVEEKLFPHPFTPFLQPPGMARGTETAGAAGKHQESFLATVWTADAGKPAAGVAAIEVALDHLLDDRAEETILLLEPALVFRQEAVEVMEQHPIEDSPLGMSRTVNSCHSRSFSSRNGPARSTPGLCPPAPGRCCRRPSLFAPESKQEMTNVRRRRQQALSRNRTTLIVGDIIKSPSKGLCNISIFPILRLD